MPFILPPPPQSNGIGDQLAKALLTFVAARHEKESYDYNKQAHQFALKKMQFQEQQDKADEARKIFEQQRNDALATFSGLTEQRNPVNDITNGVSGIQGLPEDQTSSMLGQMVPANPRTLEEFMANAGPGLGNVGKTDTSAAVPVGKLPMIQIPFTQGQAPVGIRPKSYEDQQQEQFIQARIAQQIARGKSYAEQQGTNQANIDNPVPVKVNPKDLPHLPTDAELSVLGEYGKSVDRTKPITESQLQSGRQAFDSDRSNARQVEQNKQSAATRAEAAATRIADKTASLADKSYNKYYGDLKKYDDDLNTGLTRAQRLQDTLAQPNMVADSVVAPEFLIAMAGGMGSGLRINEAEIDRVVGGRPLYQDLKAKLNKIAGGDKSVSILSEERKKMLDLIQTVKDRATERAGIIDETRDKLLEKADSPAMHKQLMSEFNKKWDATFSASPKKNTADMTPDELIAYYSTGKK